MDNSNIILSVCVITYNQESTIRDTMDSILSQEHNYNYEIVVGEDCSTDGTRKILEEYVRKYPDIIKPIYNEENMGAVRNYFNTILHCCGKYIMECGGDDYWLPRKVERQIAFMEENEAIGLVYSDVRIFHQRINRFTRWRHIVRTSFKNFLKDDYIIAPSVCFRKSLFDIYYTEIDPLSKNWMMEDYPMWIWFSVNSKISYINKELCVYRENLNSVSHSDSIIKLNKFCDSVFNVKKYFADLYKINLSKYELENMHFSVYLMQLRNGYSYEMYTALCEFVRSCKNPRNKFLFMFTKNKFIFNFYLIFSKVRNLIKYSINSIYVVLKYGF